MMGAALWALLALALDPDCAPGPAEPHRDASLAATYASVAQEEAAHGRAETARTALRRALALDPNNRSLQQAWGALCHASASAGPSAASPGAAALLSRGLDTLGRGNCQEALPAFEDARSQGEGAQASLYAGICLYRLDRLEEARERLEEARQAPALAPRASFYLGLLSHARGDESEATALFQVAAGSPDRALRWEALLLRHAAARTGRLTVTAQLGGRFDTSRAVDPDGAPSALATVGGSTGVTPALVQPDGAASGLVSGVVQPFGLRGPYAQLYGLFRRQGVSNSLNYGGVGSALGYQWLRHTLYAQAEYDYDYGISGALPYLSGHQLSGAVRVPAGPLAASLLYAIKYLQYLPAGDPTAAAYSGLHQRGELSASLYQGRASLRLGYRLSGMLTRSADGTLGGNETSYLEHGPELGARWDVSPALRLRLAADAQFRSYAALNPLYAATAPRSDVYIDASALGELDLTDQLTLQVSVAARQALSNLADVSPAGLAAPFVFVASMGLSFQLGVL